MAIIEGMICGKNQSPVSRHFWTMNNIQQAIKWNLGINFYSYLLYMLKSATLRSQHIFKVFGAIKLHGRLSLINLFLNFTTQYFMILHQSIWQILSTFHSSWQQCPFTHFQKWNLISSECSKQYCSVWF